MLRRLCDVTGWTGGFANTFFGLTYRGKLRAVSIWRLDNEAT